MNERKEIGQEKRCISFGSSVDHFDRWISRSDGILHVRVRDRNNTIARKDNQIASLNTRTVSQPIE